jgi:hypothetical protein
MSKNKNVDKSEELKNFLQNECDDLIDVLLGYGDPVTFNETPVQFVVQDGGGEGGGEGCFTILRVGDAHYKVTYSYASYDGFNFDYMEVKKVVPRTKVVVEFE